MVIIQTLRKLKFGKISWSTAHPLRSSIEVSDPTMVILNCSETENNKSLVAENISFWQSQVNWLMFVAKVSIEIRNKKGTKIMKIFTTQILFSTLTSKMPIFVETNFYNLRIKNLI